MVFSVEADCHRPGLEQRAVYDRLQPLLAQRVDVLGRGEEVEDERDAQGTAR